MTEHTHIATPGRDRAAPGRAVERAPRLFSDRASLSPPQIITGLDAARPHLEAAIAMLVDMAASASGSRYLAEQCALDEFMIRAEMKLRRQSDFDEARLGDVLRFVRKRLDEDFPTRH
jgi:hypothetical protein